jgi:hypothetical protein
MKLKLVVVEFEPPSWLRRAFAICAPIAGVLATGAVLAAPKQWSNGQALTAADLNALTVITKGSTQYSVGATHFCGTSPSTTNGKFSYNGLTGYAAAKAMCEGSSGCGMSKTAHMCDASEMVRSYQLGDSFSGASGWFSIGAIVPLNNSQFNGINDCSGWNDNSTNNSGETSYGSGSTLYSNCSSPQLVLCCD